MRLYRIAYLFEFKSSAVDLSIFLKGGQAFLPYFADLRGSRAYVGSY